MQICLGPSEYITEVRGTIGPYTTPNSNLITSLKLVTNVASYGPFGQGEGTPFHIPAQSNNSIVGFFGRAGWYVDAIGVYINDQDMEKTKHKEKVLITLYVYIVLRTYIVIYCVFLLFFLFVPSTFVCLFCFDVLLISF